MSKPKEAVDSTPASVEPLASAEFVIITGMSGSGKQTALKAFEDLGFHAVDNLPIALVSKFADLTQDAKTRRRAALIIDIREGETLTEFPAIFAELKQKLNCKSFFWTPKMKCCAAASAKPGGRTRWVASPRF